MDCCNIQDGAFCDNSYRLPDVNYYYKVLHLECCWGPRSASANIRAKFLFEDLSRGHQLSTYAKFSKKLTFLIRGLEMFVFRKILLTYLMDAPPPNMLHKFLAKNNLINFGNTWFSLGPSNIIPDLQILMETHLDSVTWFPEILRGKWNISLIWHKLSRPVHFKKLY